MLNIREILRKKILNEFFNDSESTHFDTVANRKVKVFMDTIDPTKNTAKAEITSGKSKGLFTIVNLDNLLELNPNKMVAEGESGYYPAGAEFDSRAPWNEKSSDSEISSYTLNDETQQVQVELSNGNTVEIDYIDVLEKYWKDNPGTFEANEKEFGHLEDQMDIALIKKIESEDRNKFENYLYQIAEQSDSFYDSEEDEFDRDYERDEDF